MSKNPKTRVLGPKYSRINGIAALKPYYLGPCTLRLKRNLKEPYKPVLSAGYEGNLGIMEKKMETTIV